MYQNDYIMRQIEMAVRFIVKLLCGEDIPVSEYVCEANFTGDAGELVFALKEHIRKLELNEAENLLYATLKENPCQENLKAALWFYTELGKLSEDKLKMANFTHEEILDGLASLKGMIINYK